MEPTTQQTQTTGGKNTLIAITVLIILVIAGVFYLAKKTEQEASLKTDTVTTAQETTVPQAVPSSPTSVASAVATSSEPKMYTMTEVATHNTAASCWTTVGDNVYDLTNFEDKHPGGKKAILKLCGVDGTANFTAQHGGKKGPMGALDKLKIGVLQK